MNPVINRECLYSYRSFSLGVLYNLNLKISKIVKHKIEETKIDKRHATM